MLNPFIIFNNLFRSNAITPERLYGFGVVVLQSLILANSNKQFDEIIATITAALSALKKEMTGVDTNLSGQKTETRTVDEFIVSFYTFMSENEPFIAKQLGGRKSAGYMMMYPYKLSEYSNATKTTMPTLTARVKAVAEKYAADLDPELAATLQSFEPDFEKQYGTQQQQIKAVKQDRTGKNSTFVQLQLALTASIFAVGYRYPGNVDVCKEFFPFKMLYSQRPRKRYTLEGEVQKAQVITLANHALNKTAVIICTSKSINAAYAVWWAATPADAMPADAFVINPNDPPRQIKAAKLDSLDKKMFMMMKNLSEVNACPYEVSFVGLKTPMAGAKVTDIKDDEMKVSQAS